MVAVLLALAFLVKYLFDEQYITPPIITVTGMLLGVAVMVGGEMTHRRDYEIQSQALTGGSAAVLYLTLWAGLHWAGIIGSSVTFVAMAIVTAVAASQALRHDSETIASFAWVAGYLVPLLIGEQSGGTPDGGSSSAAPLFIYLGLLSVGVFVVAQRRPWPAFTGLALMGAYSGAAYMFRVSDGSLEWTLAYLLLITAGMLWVAASRKGAEGGNFGAIGGIAGYLITAIVMMTSDSGSAFVAYFYLLILSGGLLFLSRIYSWPALTWCAVIGSIAGFLLLYYTGATQVGNWLLLYVILSVTGAVAASYGGDESAEPLGITAVGSAYGAAAFLVWAPGAKSITGDALFGYLALLAAGVLFVTVRLEWPTFSRLSLSAAFLATVLLYQHVPGMELNLYALMYAVLLSAASLAVVANLDDRILGGIACAGTFLALPLTGVMGQAEPQALVPGYLTVAAVATIGLIEYRKWYGLEWFAIGGAWLLHATWRIASGNHAPDPADLAFTSAYWLIFLVANWVRHGVRERPAEAPDAMFACVNAAAYFAIGYYDLSRSGGDVYGPGAFALALFAVYLVAGLAGLRRCPGETYFAPFLLGISIVFLTVAMPLVLGGYPVTVAWAAEATVLVGLGFLYRSQALRVAGLIVLSLGLFKALAVDSSVSREAYALILNSRALSLLAVIAAMYVSSYLYLRRREDVDEDEHWLGSGLGSAATALLLWIASIETWTYVGWRLGADAAAQQFALSGVWLAFSAVFVQLALARRIAYLRWAALALLGATIGKVFLADPGLRADTYTLLLNNQALPCLGVAALLYQIAYWYARSRESVHEDERWVGTALGVAATILLLWTASAETWREVGWELQKDLVAQHFALSGVWLVFGAVLIQIGIWRRIAYLRWAALALLTATVYKVFALDPPLTRETYALLVNSHALPLLVIAALLCELAYWHYRRSEEPVYGMVMGVAASMLLFWVCCSETWMYLGWERQLAFATQHLGLSMVWLVFGMAVMAIGLAKRQAAFRWVGLGLFALTGIKVFAIDPALSPSNYQLLANHHAFPLIVIAAMLYACAVWYGRIEDELPAEEQLMDRILPIIASIVLWWVVSSEAWRYVGWVLGKPAAQQYALTAAWTAYGAVLITVGLLRHQAAYRWAALGLFAVTVAKVGIFDLQALELPLKILAVLGLGSVLIAVSFGYQRLVRAQEGAGDRSADT